ncbi:MAG TPA: HslU--HslV peptidase proteolytic subunit, partial [Candidatus Marinimicrobia bacterium]|nr:HslU--HslV peptidase proteolytic subunit [Candidatus Neomarinimicrobiota bacterium]
MGGDGQITFGDMALKQKAVKVRKFEGDKKLILGGFAGAAADALTLFGKFEEKLEEYNWQLQRAV